MFDQDAWDKKQKRLASELRDSGSSGAVRCDPDEDRELTLEECNELVTQWLNGTLPEHQDYLETLAREWGKDSRHRAWTRERILGLIQLAEEMSQKISALKIGSPARKLVLEILATGKIPEQFNKYR